MIQIYDRYNAVCINAKIHTGNVFMTRDLDLWPIDHKINGFPVLIVEHFFVKFGDLTYRGFWDIVTNGGRNSTPATALITKRTKNDTAQKKRYK